MPFKSKAQRRKFAALLVEGKISPETYEEWNRSTGKITLPERLHPEAKKSKVKSKRRTKAKTKTKKRTAKAKRPKAKRPRAKARTRKR